MKKLYSLLIVMVALVAIGAYQTINIGVNPNDGTGDTLRAAFQKVNANFTQVTADFVSATNKPGYGAWLTNWDSRSLFFTNSVVGGGIFQWNFNGVDQSLELDVNGFTVFPNFYPGGSVIQGQGGTNVISDSGSKLSAVGFTNGTATASNFVHTAWKWVDVLQSGTAIASNPSGDPPVLTEVPGGSNFFGYAYYSDSATAGDKSYFSIQGVHKFASTNAANPNVWFEPHIHVSCTNMPANLSNATFRLDLVYATVYGRYTNGYVRTNTFPFTNIYSQGILSFGNVTNNALSGKSSVLFKGRIMRINGGDGDLGNGNPVWVDSLDIHMPTTELGSIGQFGD